MSVADRFFWCDIGYACFGFVAKDDIIVDAAPIFRWAIKKGLTEVKPWLKKRNAKIIEIK